MRRLIMSRLIWIYAVCKSLLSSHVAVEEFKAPSTAKTDDIVLFFIENKYRYVMWTAVC